MTNITSINRKVKSRNPVEYFYGVEIDQSLASPDLTRIGNTQLHTSLPIQSRMKRCLLLNDGTVNYYCDPLDSNLKEDGTAAVLDGTDGQFMVEIPEHYVRIEQDANIVKWKLSELQLLGFTRVPKHYVSVGEANLQRSTNKLSCVVNTTADYRGGNNTSAWDGASNSLLGRPVTNVSATNFRTYAHNRGAGWCREIPTIFNTWRRLMFIEFATRNVQQGTLGPGVTTANSTEWSNYNSYNPFVPIGHTASLGNYSGVKNYVANDFGGTGVNRTFEVPSYRGIENPWGHIWKWLDGFNLYAQTEEEGGEFLIYMRDSTEGLADNTSDGYELIGTLPRSSAWVEKMHFGHLLPVAAGGSGTGSTTFWCDYYYSNATTSFGWRVPLVGGRATYGADAGPVCVNTNCGASSAFTTIGSRLCFLGA